MKKLKEKILKSLKNTKQIEPTLNTLSKSQENLLKNYSNPVFNREDKGKILEEYTNLQKLGNSLYRYDALKENNYLADAQEEKRNIEDIVLKGGIVYYVWHSDVDEKICDECKNLDGKVFDYYDEVPERPHPNCRCTVEIVKDEKQDNDEKRVPPIPSPKPTPLPEPEPEKQPEQKQQPQKWIMPCKGPIVGQYGEPRSNHIHNGIDIAVPIGTPIKAVADGTVVEARPASGYGKFVVIEHVVNGQTVTSEYGHISKWLVYKEQVVKQGQVIALSGNEGYSQGPHLHLTIRIGKYRGRAVNPWDYIKN